jgi:hypothetical protein
MHINTRHLLENDMTNVTVKIAGGSEKENTTAVTVGAKRWGDNGTARFGQAQAVDAGNRTLTAYKITEPTSIAITVEVSGDNQTFNVTVNKDTISVS